VRARPACVFLLLALAASAGEDAAGLAERLRALRIERFFAYVEARTDLPPETKAKVLRLREGATLGGEYCCIHQSLLLMEPEYRRADALLLGERYAAAAERLERLAGSPDPYLAIYARYRLGLTQMHRELYEQAAETFRAVLNDPGARKVAGCDVDAAFYLAVALGQSREKERAVVAARRFLDDYPDAPERYRKAMEQTLNELLQEWESPLYDLAGRMSHVGRAIDGGETGEPTQAKQKEIVEILDKLIEEAEQGEGGGKGGGNNRGGRPRGNQPPDSPADRTALPPGPTGVGDLGPKRKPKPGEKWGEMRDRERDEVLQSLKEKLPERYRDLLEQYHRRLAEGRRATENEEAGGGE